MTVTVHKTYVIDADWITGVMNMAALSIQDLLAAVGHATLGGSGTTEVMRVMMHGVHMVALCVSVAR